VYFHFTAVIIAIIATLGIHPKFGFKKRLLKKPLVGRSELGNALIKTAQSQETQQFQAISPETDSKDALILMGRT
jgi:hypothetical protein